jgi:hypothetical protein
MVVPLSPDAFHASRLSSFIPRLFGLVMIYRHTRLYSRYSARLSPDRQACLRHASRSQARTPQSPSSYHDRQIVRSPAYSRPMRSRFLCPRKRVLGCRFAPSAPPRYRSGYDDGSSLLCLRFARHTGANSLHDTSSGVIKLVNYRKEIV